MKLTISLLTILVFTSGYYIQESYAEISENQIFLLEGSGFAVTEESIKLSELDIGISSKQQSGSSINFLTEDGFVTIDDEEFLLSELEGKFLREGRYIRINGNVESSTGVDTTISFFGRLVEKSTNASVYGFTGRITTPDDSYKIIYTTKLSILSQIESTPISSNSDNLIIHILRGSHSSGISDSYVGLSSARDDALATQSSSDPLRLGYFSADRIAIEPGTAITIVNNDVVSHSILSGKENYGSRNDPFTADGRISTGEILPGGSVEIKFTDAGFYRLYDPDYTWMRIIAYVFPNSESLIFGEGQNLGN